MKKSKIEELQDNLKYGKIQKNTENKKILNSLSNNSLNNFIF